jgi:hypothetical protein
MECKEVLLTCLRLPWEKEELGKRLYHLYNKEIFGESLPADMEITWNVR